MAFQVGSSLLDACVLAVICREDVYGYILTQNVREIMEVSESTLYPVLRRLQKEGCLSTYDQPFQGRNRRYYQITDFGRERYVGYISEWKDFRQKVDNVLLGGEENE